MRTSSSAFSKVAVRRPCPDFLCGAASLAPGKLEDCAAHQAARSAAWRGAASRSLRKLDEAHLAVDGREHTLSPLSSCVSQASGCASTRPRRAAVLAQVTSAPGIRIDIGKRPPSRGRARVRLWVCASSFPVCTPHGPRHDNKPYLHGPAERLYVVHVARPSSTPSNLDRPARPQTRTQACRMVPRAPPSAACDATPSCAHRHAHASRALSWARVSRQHAHSRAVMGTSNAELLPALTTARTTARTTALTTALTPWRPLPWLSPPWPPPPPPPSQPRPLQL